MPPKMEQPKQYTPEEIAELEKSRTISDAELLKDGAEYKVDEKGEKMLVIDKEHTIRSEHDKMFNAEMVKPFVSGIEEFFRKGGTEVDFRNEFQQKILDKANAEVEESGEGAYQDFDYREISYCPSCQMLALEYLGEEELVEKMRNLFYK